MPFEANGLYPPLAGSPVVYLSAAITNVQTTIPLTDMSLVPDGPNILTIGTGPDSETYFYEAKGVGVCTGVERGIEGVAKAWDGGTPVASVPAAQVIRALQNRLIAAEADILSQAGDLSTHEAEKASLAELGHVKVDGTTISIDGDGIISAASVPGEEPCVVANSGTAYTFDLSLGSAFAITMTGNCTFTMPAIPAGGSGKAKSFTVWFIQDATGGRSITLPSANVAYPSGVAPTFSTTANRVDKVVFSARPGATKWDCDIVGVHYS